MDCLTSSNCWRFACKSSTICCLLWSSDSPFHCNGLLDELPIISDSNLDFFDGGSASKNAYFLLAKIVALQFLILN